MTSRRTVLAFLASLWPAATAAAAAAVSPPAPDGPSTLGVQPPIAPLEAYNLHHHAGGTAWAIGDAIRFTTTYVGAGSIETFHGPISNTLIASSENPVLNPGRPATVGVTIYGSSHPAVTHIRVYLNINGTWRGYIDVTNQATAIAHYRSTIGQPGTLPVAAAPPCFVCGSLDVRDLELNVSGRIVDSLHESLKVHRNLPVEQYCGNCGTKRINRWAL